MATTIATLKKRFKAANRRVDKAIDRYRVFASKLFMPWGDNKIVNVADIIFHRNGKIENATNLSWEFYRRGRNGKFYEKPQRPVCMKLCEVHRLYGCGECPLQDTSDLVGQDYLDLRKLEYALEAAIDERERLIDELKAAGVDAFAEDDLWE